MAMMWLWGGADNEKYGHEDLLAHSSVFSGTSSSSGEGRCSPVRMGSGWNGSHLCTYMPSFGC